MFGNPLILRKTLLVSLALSAVIFYAPAGWALDFGNMMNPGRWFGGNHDDDNWDDARYGYGAPPYGPPPPPYGYGAPGIAPPAYGYGPAPMVAAPGYGAPTQAQPQTSTTDPAEELATLKERVRQLEEEKRQKRQSLPPTLAQPAHAAPSPANRQQAPEATGTSPASGPNRATYPYPSDSTEAHSVMDPSQAVFRPWNKE